MPLKQAPTYKAVEMKQLEITQPGVGGIDLFDLEYEQEVNQSPMMLNMMYRNGTFSKRYGQAKYLNSDFSDEIYAFCYFGDKKIVHSGTKMYVDGVEKLSGIATQTGKFINFYQILFYKCNGVIYEYKYENNAWAWNTLQPYVPDAFINCQPQSGGTYDRLEDLNLLSHDYNCVYNGTSSAVDYFPYGNEDEIIDWDLTDTNIVVKVDDEVKTKGTDYTVDKQNKKIHFTTAPGEGTLNVEIKYTMKDENLKEDRDRLLACKYSICYGANGGMHLFLCGGGDSKMFYSESYDPTYFPENNWIIIGSSEEDMTGFGLQYNVLIAFKPKEIYSLYSYQVTASLVTSEEEEMIGTEAFSSNIVNSSIGCDCPNTIQLIDNKLIWLNSNKGICALVSTNISDERNVREISRNINNRSTLDVDGILDIQEDKEKIVSIDYDHKYFLVFPTSGKCFMWDYEIAPYAYTSSRETDARKLAWFLFDNIYAKQFTVINKDLVYLPSKTFNKNLIVLTKEFKDLDFTSGNDKGINSYYMTPFFQFDAVEYLKTVKNIYVQCRGDTASAIDMYYYTEESLTPEQEPESIRIGGRIWTQFDWSTFQWLSINHANAFRRKCSLKKIQMASFYFVNSDIDRDMSISHISLHYQIIKAVK